MSVSEHDMSAQANESVRKTKQAGARARMYVMVCMIMVKDLRPEIGELGFKHGLERGETPLEPSFQQGHSKTEIDE